MSSYIIKIIRFILLLMFFINGNSFVLAANVTAKSRYTTLENEVETTSSEEGEENLTDDVEDAHEELETDGELNLSIFTKDLKQNIEKINPRLRFKADVSVLMKEVIYPQSFEIEIYNLDTETSKTTELLSVIKPLVLNKKHATQVKFSTYLNRMKKSGTILLNVYDSQRTLYTSYHLDLELEGGNKEETDLASLANSTCGSEFGECHIEYLIKNLRFENTIKKAQIEARKNIDGGYTIFIPTSIPKKSFIAKNKILNSSELNLAGSGVGTQGPKGDKGDKGEKGETGATGPMGPMGPAGSGGSASASGTIGSVQFVDGSSNLDSDSNEFIWDNTNKRLGIGEVTPTADLEVNGMTLSDTFIQKRVVNNTSSSTVDINWTQSNRHKIVLDQNVTLTFTSPTEGVGSFSLFLEQDGIGSRTVTWPANVKWASGSVATLSTPAGAIDIVSCLYDGTDFFCHASNDFF